MQGERRVLSDWQESILRLPESFDLALLGGRGAGKSYALIYLILRHVEQYGAAARAFLIRRSFPGLADLEASCRTIFGEVYGKAASFNAQQHRWKFPNGAVLELGPLEIEADFLRYQGRSATWIGVDEAQQFPDPALLDLLRSNLRGPGEIPLRMTLAANPGGAGSGWIFQRFFSGGQEDWRPFGRGREILRNLDQEGRSPWVGLRPARFRLVDLRRLTDCDFLCGDGVEGGRDESGEAEVVTTHSR